MKKISLEAGSVIEAPRDYFDRVHYRKVGDKCEVLVHVGDGKYLRDVLEPGLARNIGMWLIKNFGDVYEEDKSS